MNSKQILQKLENKAKAVRAKLTEYGREEAARKISYRNASGLTYKVRSGIFSNHSGTCEFNPESIYAHSYTWYDLVKVINGKVILNDYRYSQQTSKHIGQVSEVLRDLGIKYKTLEAPRGLQNLNAALIHEINKQARLLVREKYSRKKSGSWVKTLIRESEKNVKLLETLGIKATKKMRDLAIKEAEQDRIDRLKEQREKRAEQKKMDSLMIIPDFDGMSFEMTGFHVVHDRAWSWNDETGEYTGRISDYEKREAVAKGFDRIIVHRSEPRHLKLVR